MTNNETSKSIIVQDVQDAICYDLFLRLIIFMCAVLDIDLCIHFNVLLSFILGKNLFYMNISCICHWHIYIHIYIHVCVYIDLFLNKNINCKK